MFNLLRPLLRKRRFRQISLYQFIRVYNAERPTSGTRAKTLFKDKHNLRPVINSDEYISLVKYLFCYISKAKIVKAEIVAEKNNFFNIF